MSESALPRLAWPPIADVKNKTNKQKMEAYNLS